MKKTFATVLVCCVAIIWAGGCQEEQTSSGDKATRLMAVENRDLRAQLQAEKKKTDEEIKKLSEQLTKAQAPIQAEITKRDDEIRKLNEAFQTEIKNRDDDTIKLKAAFQAEIKSRDEEILNVKKQLDQCEKTRDERLVKEIDKDCQETVANLMNWTSELVAENERLKAAQADAKGEPNK